MRSALVVAREGHVCQLCRQRRPGLYEYGPGTMLARLAGKVLRVCADCAPRVDAHERAGGDALDLGKEDHERAD